MNKFCLLLASVLSILGCVLGAGFVSGAEIVTFFVNFGWLGIVGIIFSATIFCFGIFYIYNHYAKNENLGNKINLLPYCQFFISATMFAGLSSMFPNKIIANFIIFSLLAVCLFFGVKCANFINVIVSICVIVILPFVAGQKQSVILNVAPPNFMFLLYAILYSLMNIVTSAEIIKSITQNKSKKFIIFLMLVVFFLIVLLQLTVFFLCTSSFSQMPILDGVDGWLLVVYKIILVVAMGSTIVSSSVGAKHVFDNICGQKYNLVSSVMTSLVIFLFSFVGFSNIIKYVYPAIGAILLFQISINKIINYKKNNISKQKSI